MSIYIGMMLYGYCNGYFGRDSHENKRIEAIGHDWVVVREENGVPSFARFKSNGEMTTMLANWSMPENKNIEEV